MSKYSSEKLGVAAEIVPGFAFKSEEFGDKGTIAVKIKDINPPIINIAGADNVDISNYSPERLRKYEIHKGDFVVAMTGATIGKIGKHVSEELLYINQRVAKIAPRAGFCKEFVYYAIQGGDFFKFILHRLDSSSAQGNISGGSIGEYAIPCPDINTQRRVAAVLSTLDAKIELNNRINEELEGLAKLLYDYWFVQFDLPITAAQAAAMGKPHLKGEPYRAHGGKMVYREALKREIPAGWRHSTIGQIFKTHLGGTPSRENEDYWTPGEVNWLSSGENPSTFVVAPDEQISKLGLQNSPAKLLPVGTVILSIVRHLRASILGIEAATNQSVVGIVETKTFKHCFIYPYLVREIPRLMVLRTGAQQPHINKGVLDASLLVVPDESTLEAYTSLAAPLFLQIKNHHQQNRELTKLRDWLLPMLMNGQVTVG